jgi:hypothetical protein
MKLADGNHFDHASCDLEQLEVWSTSDADANVGIIPDEHHCYLETDSETELKELAADAGIPADAFATTRVSSGRPDRCYFIYRQTQRTRDAGDITAKSRKTKDNLFELKAFHTYVVGPGSIHPDTKRPYVAEWRNHPSLPTVLLNLLLELHGGPGTARARGKPEMNEETKRQTTLLDSFCETYEVATTGDWLPKGKQWFRPIVCPWEAEHTNDSGPDSTCIVYNVGGGFGFKCQHRCVTKSWGDFRAEVQSRFPDRKFSFVEPTAGVTIGKSVRVTSDVMVDLVEEIDPNLKATPLPKYPLRVWAGTLYMEFAKCAALGNYVPLEFFIEGAMTYAGAIAGVHVRHKRSEEVTLRMYTALLAYAGIGKGTTFRRIRKFAPSRRVLDFIDPESPPTYCAALLSRPASENGLNESLLQHAHVLLEFEEMDQLMGKTEITGNGAILSIIRTCFDDIAPGITTCKGRPVAASAAFVSLLGAMTPSLWRKAMEGRDSYGSGLGGRFNLVASNEDRTASTLVNMDLGDLQEQLNAKFTRLDNEELIIDTEPGALKLMNDWWTGSRGRAHYNRVNVIAHRKAMHLAWMRGSPVITTEIMRDALLLADYLVAVRDVFAVSKGDDRTAIGENKVLHILRHISPKAVTAKQIVSFLDGMMSRSGVFSVLRSLAESGEAERLQINPVAGRPYAVYRVVQKGVGVV